MTIKMADMPQAVRDAVLTLNKEVLKTVEEHMSASNKIITVLDTVFSPEKVQEAQEPINKVDTQKHKVDVTNSQGAEMGGGTRRKLIQPAEADDSEEINILFLSILSLGEIGDERVKIKRPAILIENNMVIELDGHAGAILTDVLFPVYGGHPGLYLSRDDARFLLAPLLGREVGDVFRA